MYTGTHFQNLLWYKCNFTLLLDHLVLTISYFSWFVSLCVCVVVVGPRVGADRPVDEQFS